jgi:flagellar biosynthesis GTPase FlhF
MAEFSADADKSAFFSRVKKLQFRGRKQVETSSAITSRKCPDCDHQENGLVFEVVLEDGKGKHRGDGARITVFLWPGMPNFFGTFPEIPRKVLPIADSLFPRDRFPPSQDTGFFTISMDRVFLTVDIRISYNQKYQDAQLARKTQKEIEKMKAIEQQEQRQRYQQEEQQRRQQEQQRREEEHAKELAEAKRLNFDTVAEMIADRKQKELEAKLCALELKEKERRAELAAEEAMRAEKARADRAAKIAQKEAERLEKFGSKKGSPPPSSSSSRGSSSSPPPGGCAKGR